MLQIQIPEVTNAPNTISTMAVLKHILTVVGDAMIDKTMQDEEALAVDLAEVLSSVAWIAEHEDISAANLEAGFTESNVPF